MISVATGVVSSPLLSLASGQGAAAAASQGTSTELNTMKSLQDQNQKFSMDYLKIQMQMQEENRRFSTLSNISKAKHDTAKAAIQNIRT